MKNIIAILFASLLLWGCAKDSPYLSGHVRRANDAVLVQCDPYNKGVSHTCMVVSPAFQDSLYVYDATAREWVLAPDGYSPLKIKLSASNERLVKVVSDNDNFPFLIAVYRAKPSYYAVRLFESPDQKAQALATPIEQSLGAVLFDMGAVEYNDMVLGITSVRDPAGIEVIAINNQSGAIDNSVKAINIELGTKPGLIAIDSQRQSVVVLDRGENSLHILSVKDIHDSLLGGDLPAVRSIDVAFVADQLYLSTKKFGDALATYALLINNSGKKIKLVDIDKGRVVAEHQLKDFPKAAYFPGLRASPCCDGKKDWFSIVSIKGVVTYFSINLAQSGASITEEKNFDLTSERNLDLKSLRISKILGAAISPSDDASNSCSGGRETFYISSYANSLAHRLAEPQEVEGHAHSCEGKNLASRLGSSEN